MDSCRRSASIVILRFLLLILWITVTAKTRADAQTIGTSPETGRRGCSRISPILTTLPQLVVIDSYTLANYGPCTPLACVRNYETNQLTVKQLIPRVPPRTLLPFAQLIRPTLSLVTVPSSRGGTRTEFGDLQLFDVAILPCPTGRQPGCLMEWDRLLCFPPARQRAPARAPGRPVQHSGRSTRVCRDCWWASSHKTRFLSLTHHPTARLRIHLSFNRFLRFTSGSNGTYARPRLNGRWAGVDILRPCYRSASESAAPLSVRTCLR